MRVQRPVFIIAEAGVNHNGSLKLAKQLIDAAYQAGADAVKFQTFRAESLVTKTAPKALYQLAGAGSSESQYEMLRRLEMDENSHRILASHCRKRGIQFLSTPFDLESLNLLVRDFDLSCIKISSGDITNAPLLLQAARAQKPILLSTGMSTLAEIRDSLGVLAQGYLYPRRPPSSLAFREAFASQSGKRILGQKVTLLHCTTEYPAPYCDVNLSAMITLHNEFNLPVGYSDHTSGIAVAIAAVALGATVIEKHFTLNKALSGPDHLASLNPEELSQMVSSIRETEQALGKGRKVVMPSETANRLIARKSLVAARAVRQGENFTGENLTVKRPGSGISPMEYWLWLGKKANKDYGPDDLIIRNPRVRLRRKDVS